jgi:hypothetical protein
MTRRQSIFSNRAGKKQVLMSDNCTLQHRTLEDAQGDSKMPIWFCQRFRLRRLIEDVVHVHELFDEKKTWML